MVLLNRQIVHVIILLLGFNNGVTLQWGNGRFPKTSTNNIAYNITLPISTKSINIATINADVGVSGWGYMNAVCSYRYTASTFGGRHTLGNGTNIWYSWICVGC